MANILPFDELNVLKESLSEHFADGRIKSRKDKDDIEDMLLDLFLLAFARGRVVTEMRFPSNWNPDSDEVMRTVDANIAGETWRQRVEDYYENGGSVGDIIRIAETETHRIANTAAIHAARVGGATMKTWATMLDDRVREQHEWLEGVTVGIDDEFVTYDGDHALAPGLFELPENNINCRCELVFN